jgi:uncharacterized membrane protein YhhN
VINIWLFVAAGAALANWLAVEKNWKVVEYVTKPGTMAALLLWLWTSAGLQGPLLLFALGLVFSLAGDVFLMLPSRPFIAGLVAFLLAHLAYISGFNIPLPPLSLPGLIMAVMIGFAARSLYRRLCVGLVKTGEGSLRRPVLIYASAISLMLLSALLTTTRNDWGTAASLLASAGAILFFASDTLLAWDRCITPLTHRGLKVMTSYHLGQFAITAAAILQFAG